MKIVQSLNKLGEIIVFKKWEPIGTIKMFDREQDMSKLYYGTWELTLKERSPIGINPDSTDDRFKTVGNKFGEKEHTLTVEEIPKHLHNDLKITGVPTGVANGTQNSGLGLQYTSNYNSKIYTGETGGDKSHNNIHPVEVVYFYKRVA